MKLKRVSIPQRYALLIAVAHLAQGLAMIAMLGRFYLPPVERAVMFSAGRAALSAKEGE